MTNINSFWICWQQHKLTKVGPGTTNVWVSGAESEQLRGYFVTNETLLGKKDHQEAKFHQCHKQHVCNYGAISGCGETSGTKPKSVLDVSDLRLLRRCCLKNSHDSLIEITALAQKSPSQMLKFYYGKKWTWSRNTPVENILWTKEERHHQVCVAALRHPQVLEILFVEHLSGQTSQSASKKKVWPAEF